MTTSAAAATAERRKALLLRLRRRKHDVRVRFWRVFAVSSFFVIAVGANLYFGAAVITDNFGAAFKPGKFTPPERNAHMSRPLADGVFCRNITFDNTTAESVSDKIEHCDGRPHGPNYQIPRTQFTWGKSQ